MGEVQVQVAGMLLALELVGWWAGRGGCEELVGALTEG